jgi:hypothetical protein
MSRPAKIVMHVNRNIIDGNRKHGRNAPPLTVKYRGGNFYGHSAIIRDRAGREIGRMVHSPDKPLSCGARVWVQLDDRYVTVEATNEQLDGAEGCALEPHGGCDA